VKFVFFTRGRDEAVLVPPRNIVIARKLVHSPVLRPSISRSSLRLSSPPANYQRGFELGGR
jgi:hypothetical protein